MPDSEIDSDAPRPRLCHLRKSPDFAGYGFNLHAEKGKAGQFIGKVDDGSPAEAAGLKEGDRIIEVNGINVGSENHGQVVQRIKSVVDEVTFLVVDEETDAYYRDRKIVITGDLDNILRLDSFNKSRSNSSASSASSKHSTGSGHYQLNNNMAHSDDGDSSALRPRLCELKLWSDFPGYGFNLHADNGQSGQYISKVDAGSPADAAGVKDGDRIIEVNGINIEDETHSEVVMRIKSMTGRVSLLVVDPETDRHFRERGVEIDGSLDVVRRLESPDVNPAPGVAAAVLVADQINDALGDHDYDEAIPHTAAVAAAAAAAANRSRSTSRSRSRSRSSSRSSRGGDAAVVTQNHDENHHIASAIAAVATTAAAVVVVSAAKDEHAHRARLCVVRNWKDGKGYGFNMQNRKGKPGQYIGKVDPGSPAALAGLKDGDRIVEVNGFSVDSMTHKDVVDKIKSKPDEVTLLVVCPAADEYFKGKNLTPSSETHDTFERHVCPDTKPHRVRLSIVRSWKDGRGFGFSMQAQKGKDGHFIGKVDAATPAELAGLKEGDRIVEVNGSNVDRATHKEVVEKIKANLELVKLLVVDPKADAHFTEAGIKLSGSLDIVDKVECPETKPANLVAKAKDNKTTDGKPLSVDVNAKATSNSTSSTPPTTSPTSPRASVIINGIEFAATVEEARRKVSKKQDVRSNRLSMKDKYELFQKL